MKRRGILLLLPTLSFVFVFFLIPLLMVFGQSVYHPSQGWSLSTYMAFFQDRVAKEAYFRSLYIGLWVTIIAIIISYPASSAIVGIKNSSLKTILMTLTVLPLMTNPVARTFAWLAILGRHGLINKFFIWLGIYKEPVRLLYTEGAVFVGLLQLFMPLMLLSLVSALENIPEDLFLAARSLGANGFRTFLKVKLPLSMEGLIIGGTLVFTGSITAYVTPAILGGSRVLMLSTLLYQKASVVLDWDMATTIAVIMFLTTLLINGLLRKVGGLGRK